MSSKGGKKKGGISSPKLKAFEMRRKKRKRLSKGSTEVRKKGGTSGNFFPQKGVFSRWGCSQGLLQG